jgi:hypothetical protein
MRSKNCRSDTTPLCARRRKVLSGDFYFPNPVTGAQRAAFWRGMGRTIVNSFIEAGVPSRFDPSGQRI